MTIVRLTPLEMPDEPTPPSSLTEARRRRRQSHLPLSWPRVQLAGANADLLDRDDAIGLMMDYARGDHDEVLAVVSLNLDHLHHFGSGRTSASLERRKVLDLSISGQVRWLGLLDGAPLVRRAGELTGRPWPRLAGSDLIEPILDRARRDGLTVGFLGGSSETHKELAPALTARWPGLQVRGFWSPSRAQLDDSWASSELVAEIAAARVDILAVCLGKPRQERWIAENALASGTHLCLAFGAVVDFLAGRMNRAPEWVSSHGLEWAWRLGNEPRRLARRYLIQGPPAYRALQNDSFVKLTTTYFPDAVVSAPPTLKAVSDAQVFVGPEEYADVVVLSVTTNNDADIDAMIGSVRSQVHEQSIRMIVVDNGSIDRTREALDAHPDVVTVATGDYLGYAGGINAAWPYLGEYGSLLVISPELEMGLGSLRLLRERLSRDEVGVAVPRIIDVNGEIYASLRREPSFTRSLGDALLGERLGARPGAFSEIELDRRRYRHPHAVDWASGAALLIAADTVEAVGLWDERFFLYSEEIDYQRRIRETGAQIWFEPAATMRLRRRFSSVSDEFEALMAVNRVRYAEKWNGHHGSLPVRGAVLLGSVLRARQSRHRTALRFLSDRGRWSALPAARPSESKGD